MPRVTSDRNIEDFGITYACLDETRPPRLSELRLAMAGRFSQRKGIPQPSYGRPNEQRNPGPVLAYRSNSFFKQIIGYRPGSVIQAHSARAGRIANNQ